MTFARLNVRTSHFLVRVFRTVIVILQKPGKPVTLNQVLTIKINFHVSYFDIQSYKKLI